MNSDDIAKNYPYQLAMMQAEMAVDDAERRVIVRLTEEGIAYKYIHGDISVGSEDINRASKIINEEYARTTH